jgi:hypothetical protein
MRMNIELKPEQEQVIVQAINAGVIHDASEALDITLEVLRGRLSKTNVPLSQPRAGRNLVEVCAMVRGLTDDVDFSRDPSTDRPIDLS